MFWIFAFFWSRSELCNARDFFVPFKIMNLALMAAGVTVLLLLVNLVWRKISEK